MVIGSDTIVTLKGRIYGKPRDEEEARKTLRKLSGQKHQVVSGVVILSKRHKKPTWDHKVQRDVKTSPAPGMLGSNIFAI